MNSNTKPIKIFIAVISVLIWMPLNVLSVPLNESNPGDTIDVVHYEINIESIDTEAGTIDAFTKVRFTPLIDNINMISFELKDLEITQIKFNDEIIENYIHYDPRVDIILPEQISTGDTNVVTIHYNGIPFHESWGGFHFSGDYAFNLGVGISYIPHNLGKTWFPCVDNFTDRATYDCYVTTGDELMAVCGGLLTETKESNNGTITYHWSLPQEIPTYLASVAFGDYVMWEDIYEGMERDIPVEIYVRPQDSADVEGSFEHLNQIMAIYEDRFGAYQWDRIGYVGTAIGAMEHATNIAYPNSSINGNLSNEWLLAHELFHMWFGDLVTCCSAEEMWINEGWATYCQMFYKEDLYGTDEFKADLREMHGDVLQYCHTPSGDGDYFVLNNIPQTHTYGMTAYDKGSTVVQSMRTYMGDSLFFKSITSFLEENAFTSVCSDEMMNSLSSHSGIDMTGFFNNWVFNQGTPGYSIDSFNVMEQGENYEVHIFSRQKRKGGDFIGNDNIIELCFMDNNWEKYYDTIYFSGKTGHSIKVLDFEPQLVMIDLNSNMCDATTDAFRVFYEPESYDFPETFFGMEVEELTDSAFVRVTHHWVAPDSMQNPWPGMRLSNYRYWEIQGLLPENFEARGRFFYSKPNYLDTELITSQQDSVVILYRKDKTKNWQEIAFTKEGIWMVGNIYVENIQPGEYALAVWDTQYTGTNELNSSSLDELNIYPNPASRRVNIEYDFPSGSLIEIISSSGKIMDTLEFNSKDRIISINTSRYSTGTYIVLLSNSKKEYVAQGSLIIQ